MKPLYKQEDYEKAPVTKLFPCQCYECNKIFYKTKKAIIRVLNNVSGHTGKFCSQKCLGKNRTTKKEITCLNCNIKFKRWPNQIKKHKNHFCSSACSATYNSKHKIIGHRRSKLEIWLEKQLPKLFPTLEIHYNHDLLPRINP